MDHNIADVIVSVSILAFFAFTHYMNTRNDKVWVTVNAKPSRRRSRRS